jgi:uncharacterized membrane protein
MEGEWITLSSLGTFGGAVFAVTLISQFLKDVVDKYTHLPTRFMVLLIAWAVLLGHRFVLTGNLAFADVFLDLLNGFLVALAAMGAHSVAKTNLKWK